MEFVKSRLLDAELKFKGNEAEKYRGNSSVFYINKIKNSQNNKCCGCNRDHFYRDWLNKNVDRGYFRRSRGGPRGRTYTRTRQTNLSNRNGEEYIDTNKNFAFIALSYCLM
ncbi:hypothetical protein WA026_009267 [Henosepilachna vigintioctopunctata]|uniref:Uncharacterized protein n=1 Tax=Henosepilachna vigintioctopunctata TaxID=420089 RepID=A0AAW1UV80_9CUCU